uniref:Secreted protein n=1 Tax=Heterorhabditis bacteriophora TaxID=37862 RepID=A0A1I7WHZ1_HETBA
MVSYHTISKHRICLLVTLTNTCFHIKWSMFDLKREVSFLFSLTFKLSFVSTNIEKCNASNLPLATYASLFLVNLLLPTNYSLKYHYVAQHMLERDNNAIPRHVLHLKKLLSHNHKLIYFNIRKRELISINPLK